MSAAGGGIGGLASAATARRWRESNAVAFGDVASILHFFFFFFFGFFSLSCPSDEMSHNTMGGWAGARLTYST